MHAEACLTAGENVVVGGGIGLGQMGTTVSWRDNVMSGLVHTKRKISLLLGQKSVSKKAAL